MTWKCFPYTSSGCFLIATYYSIAFELFCFAFCLCGDFMIQIREVGGVILKGDNNRRMTFRKLFGTIFVVLQTEALLINLIYFLFCLACIN